MLPPNFWVTTAAAVAHGQITQIRIDSQNTSLEPLFPHSNVSVKRRRMMLFAPFFNAILPLFMFLVLFVIFCKVDFKKLRVTRWHGYALVAQFSIILLLLALTLLWGKSGSRLVFCHKSVAMPACYTQFFEVYFTECNEEN